MTTSPEYNPPTSETIASRQNDADALRLLIAQRRVHTTAKQWQSFHWSGLLLIGVAAPFVAVIWPSLAVVMGAIAGVWLFLGRTLIAWQVSRLGTRAAAIQEALDHYVFEMPTSVERSAFPSLEDVSKLAGPDATLTKVAKAEDLLDWYPIDERNGGAVSVAVAQRANAAYADRLLRTLVIIWIVVAALWAVGLIAVSAVLGISLVTFLAGVLLPVLPAALDIVEYVHGIRRAASDRGELARAIEKRVKAASTEPLDPQDLLVWQGQLYDLRRSTPQVPDRLYQLARRGNERAMHDVAGQLGRAARGED